VPKRLNRLSCCQECGFVWPTIPRVTGPGSPDFPCGRGRLWEVTFEHCRSCERSVSSTLFARGSSDAASVYQYAAATRYRLLDFILVLFCDTCKGVEWPAKRCYVGLVAVGFQEQAEDILVPPLLRNCLTLMTFPFLIIISPPPRTVVLAIVFTV